MANKEGSIVSRRTFLRSSAAAGGLALAAPLNSLHARQVAGFRPDFRNGYGPIAPVADKTTGLPLLKLPKGFTYESFGWTGDIMSDGTLTPDRHDGMAVVDFQWRRGDFEMTLIRNHERGAGAPDDPLPFIGNGQVPIYDSFQLPGVLAGIGGGTTAVTYGRHGFTGSQATLGGTLSNCAGGPTPWGSWLTCEETTVRGSAIGAQDHGYVYEVPSPRLGPASAVPIIDMGFMDHEAVAVDPIRNQVYLTEDNGNNSGFYRFTPHNRCRRCGDLEGGGTLEMLRVVDQPNANLANVQTGDTFVVDWVPVEDPNADPESFESPLPGFPPITGTGKSGPFLQGEANGGAQFNRGEGCWHRYGLTYFVDTSGGAAGKGVVWVYQPPRRRRKHGLLKALFVSPDEATADNPDNVTVSPRGGVLVCEDGGGLVRSDGEREFGARLVGINRDGTSFIFGENNVMIDSALEGRPFIAPNDYRGSEFAGATFSLFGRVLFVNIQTPGITFAITGPWRRGSL
ncbi:MAG: alkaline phosphatase PhoX [Pseudomonadota bacterium]